MMNSLTTYTAIVGFFVLVPITYIITNYLLRRRKVQLAVAGDAKYHGLADEYRRLSDLAITAQEHADMRLTEIVVQVEELRRQVSSLQHILAEVE